MQKIDKVSPDSKSADIVDQNIGRLKHFFPEAFNGEGKIDFEVLRQVLGEAVDERIDEKFGLNWPGKRRARQSALVPSIGTLRPRPEESLNWDTTSNLILQGDNLEVLKLLRKSYQAEVDMIYIDPPYNTGNDFIYPDDFTESLTTYLQYTGQVDAEGRKFTTNTEANGRFHSKWLSMMYPRLFLARTLLKESGVIFISIDDHELDNLMKLCNEVFGEENKLACFIWKRKAGGGDDSGHVAIEHEYVLCYARNESAAQLGAIKHESPAMTAKYNRIENGRRYYLERLDKTSLTYNASMDFEIECPDGSIIKPPQPNPQKPTTIWRWGKDRIQKDKDQLIFEKEKKTGEWRVYTKTWESLEGVTPRSLLVDSDFGRNRDGTEELSGLIGPKVFSNPKPTRLLRHLLNVGCPQKDGLVLDFFAGSGTVGQAVLEMNREDGGNRHFILVQLPEPTDREDYPTITEITKARIKASAEKIRKETPLFKGDSGYRVFELDSSNIQVWAPDKDNMQKSLLDSVEHLVPGRNDDDILFELLLKLGLSLDVPIEKKDVAGKPVYSVGFGTLIACLADSINAKDMEKLASGIVNWRKELSPVGDSVCVFRDSAFADDVIKTNLSTTLQQQGIKTIKSI